MHQESNVMNFDSPVKPLTTGVIGSIIVAIGDFFRWYQQNLPDINNWLIHIAQLGGVVMMVYSVMILRRNWKTGKNTKNPLEKAE